MHCLLPPQLRFSRLSLVIKTTSFHMYHMKILILSGTFNLHSCLFILLVMPLFMSAKWSEWTVYWPCWCKFQENTLFGLFSLICIILPTKTFHRIRLLSFRNLRKEIFKGTVLRTLSTVALFLLTKLYRDGWWC
jgi:hypothetical protein